jgi:uncharacterized coiled-coil DUF342 family protein
MEVDQAAILAFIFAYDEITNISPIESQGEEFAKTLETKIDLVMSFTSYIHDTTVKKNVQDIINYAVKQYKTKLDDMNSNFNKYRFNYHELEKDCDKYQAEIEELKTKLKAYESDSMLKNVHLNYDEAIEHYSKKAVVCENLDEIKSVVGMFARHLVEGQHKA